MAVRFHNIKSISGMLQTGLVGFGGWLSTQGESQSDIARALRFRYPNASEDVVQQGLSQIARSQNEGLYFKLSGEHPTDRTIPLDQSHASKGVYEYAVDINAYGTRESGGRGSVISERYHRFYSNTPITLSQLQEVIEDFILEQINDYPDSIPIEENQTQRELFAYDYEIVSISRSR